jgi:hypothetical protein
MGKDETKAERLARLEREVQQLKNARPEHCHGTDGYIGEHRARPDHMLKIETMEEEIKTIRKELGG